MSSYSKPEPLIRLIRFIGEILFYAFRKLLSGGICKICLYVLHYYDRGGIQCLLWRADLCQDDPA